MPSVVSISRKQVNTKGNIVSYSMMADKMKIVNNLSIVKYTGDSLKML